MLLPPFQPDRRAHHMPARLTIRALGLDLLDVEPTTDPVEYEEPGDCLTQPIEVGRTDHHMGFTLGLDDDD